ncbi:hypothetical protein HJC23_001795 [Cyclotella cryptica]|uniref:STI1/HOP DP domain-containing protein n=1 Tax=Cyclotella cryptica TaxID=29204 RepID=A0ABD3QRR6_9STRA|eukprot:CCRYP_003361-RA/>CCRYP_003361-RA protein AED:0.00 eAED:0.00 QI:99/1/1/1/0.66/0.5/4/1414/404
MMASNDLSARLQDMLRLKSINDDISSSASSAPSKPRRLIEVVGDHEASNKDSTANGSESSVDGHDDDYEPPPPIYFHGGSESSCPQQDVKPPPAVPVSPTLSLAEQMMEHANRAAQLKKHQEVSTREKCANKATFGVRKGFLNATSKPATKMSQQKSNCQTRQQKRQQKNNHQDDNDLIYELDQDGNMTPILRRTSSAHPQQSLSSSPLILPEAQHAIASHLQNYTEWASPDLIESITKKHPKLARGLGNPKFTAVLQSMQENPKETLNKLKRDEPEVLEFIQEFCGVMGDHFVKLGEKQDKTNIREMGPLEEKALRKHKTETLQKKHQPSPIHRSHDSDKAIDDQVSAILSNDDLRSILMDPKMQHIMEECSTIEGKLQYYMRHEEYGPKLRRMMEAGLLKLA